ncbi:hypothetical protein F5Y03DRAFT_399343 [Xylaria venustula]|nr:hypothetical protein F5Y03DRAFT_399343 [Xylaria venustula]
MPKFRPIEGKWLRRESAIVYLSWAEQRLTELSLCMIFLEREFYHHRRKSSMWKFAFALFRALPMLAVRIYLTLYLAAGVEWWIEDLSLDWWIWRMKRELREHTRLLAQLLRRAFRGAGWWPWRERTVVERRLWLDDRRLRKRSRGDVWLRCPVISPPAIITKRMRRVLGERKISCELRWKRERKEQK